MCENRLVRKICGTKRDEVKGEWRKLLNEELYYLCCSPYTVREIILRRKCEMHMAYVGERRDEYRILVGKPDGKRSLERTRRRC